MRATGTPEAAVLKAAARIANPDMVEDLSQYDAAFLHAVAALLERQKVSFIPIVARYGERLTGTPLVEFAERDLVRYRAQRDEFERIRLRFSVSNIESMVFKSVGAIPSFHYLSSNLDILVPEGQAAAARKCLVDLGYVELLNVEEPVKFLFRRFPGDGTSFAFHLHEVVGWGVPFLDNAIVWAHAVTGVDDPDIRIPGPSEALLVTLAHWFYEDKELSLGNLLLTAHALRNVENALAEPAAHARRRGWEEGFWGAICVFDEAWKRLFGETCLSREQHAELDRAPARYAAVRSRLFPGVRYLEHGVAARIPFKADKVAYYRKVMRDTRRSFARKITDVIDTGLWAVRWKLHIRSQPPVLISVSGIDGSGKSMQVERLRAVFETCDVRVKTVWARGVSSRGAGAVLRAGKTVLGAGERDASDTPTPDLERSHAPRRSRALREAPAPASSSARALGIQRRLRDRSQVGVRHQDAVLVDARVCRGQRSVYLRRASSTTRCLPEPTRRSRRLRSTCCARWCRGRNCRWCWTSTRRRRCAASRKRAGRPTSKWRAGCFWRSRSRTA